MSCGLLMFFFLFLCAESGYALQFFPIATDFFRCRCYFECMVIWVCVCLSVPELVGVWLYVYAFAPCAWLFANRCRRSQRRRRRLLASSFICNSVHHHRSSFCRICM